ncbi:MAG: carboxypeptidase-like regulatory domain-containing protein, partial [Gemmatimonadaceae bacterium]|nr:carboxypeptidase-like regulatory domain-containing protein [Gemmatimonadaceae bacterium]
LDSLGLTAALRELEVTRDRVSVSLATPSAETIRRALCPTTARRTTTDAGALLLGVVRAPRDGAPVADVVVTATWNELVLSPNGSARRRRAVTARTAVNGWYGLCDVPAGGVVTVQGVHGRDSTDAVDVPLTTSALARRDLYLGAAVDGVDSVAPVVLRGRIVMADAGVPVAGAEVRIARVGVTRSDAAGEWVLANVPPGTRLVEVRAVGYFRERLPVDVLGGTTRAEIALRALRPVLDTVRVRGALDRQTAFGGFDERRRSGTGRYLDAQEIARRNLIALSDVFNTMPAMRVERDDRQDRRIALSSVTGGTCEPVVFLNGMRLGPLSADEIDALAAPQDLLGIEVYREPSTPPQFSDSMSGTGCGSIVLWARYGPRRTR